MGFGGRLGIDHVPRLNRTSLNHNAHDARLHIRRAVLIVRDDRRRQPDPKMLNLFGKDF